VLRKSKVEVVADRQFTGSLQAGLSRFAGGSQVVCLGGHSLLSSAMKMGSITWFPWL
jgi:hypothetical protein